MNEVQKAAIKRADDRMKPALDLYEERNKLARLVYELGYDDTKRLNRILCRLTPDNLRSLAQIAESLAAFNGPAPE